MTVREWFKKEHPGLDPDMIANNRCPGVFDYPNNPECKGFDSSVKCDECWNREIDIPEKNKKQFDFQKDADDITKLFTPAEPVKIQYEQKSFDSKTLDEFQESIYKSLMSDMPLTKMKESATVIKDSGARREFETGAVRDIQEGKGRCDLMPLDVVSDLMPGPSSREIIDLISEFKCSGEYLYLKSALFTFSEDRFKTTFTESMYTMFLELSKHFEEGAKKYGENNWQKGIPTHCYIDSAVRHYLKYLRGDTDEPHDRAFVWNLICCIWTCIHKPELNDYVTKTEGGEKQCLNSI